MQDKLNDIRQAVRQRLDKASQSSHIEELRVSVLGRKGELTALLKGMGKLSPEERPVVGQKVNALRSEIEGRMKLGIPVILVIEVEGAGNIKKMYPGATTIFVLPPDMQELERRLRCRGTEDEETIQRRLKRAEAEIANSVNYDEHVVNIEVDSCAESIYSIIQFKLQHGSDE